MTNNTPQDAAISAQLITEKQLCRPKRLRTFYLTWAIEAMDTKRMKYCERMKFVSSHFQCSVTGRLFQGFIPAYC